MLHMSVDTRAIERKLNSLAKSQLPFAVALGINDVAGQIAETESVEVERDLDRPVPFTKRGVAVKRATKRKPVGVVGYKPIQAGYLSLHATGGKRKAKGRAVVVPVGQRLNKYGNMPKGAIGRALARPDTFSGKVGGVAGVWQRPKRKAGGSGTRRRARQVNKSGLKLLAIYKGSVSYSPRLKFVSRARRIASKQIGPAIAANLTRAIKTAR